MVYTYPNKTTEPNMEQIKLDVDASAMTDKSLEYQRWDEETAILEEVFTNTLSAPDKTILDGIVASNS